MTIDQNNFTVPVKVELKDNFAITNLHLCFIFFPARFERVSPGPNAGMFGWFHSGTVHWLFRLSMFLTMFKQNNIKIILRQSEEFIKCNVAFLKEKKNLSDVIDCITWCYCQVGHQIAH